jgi:hypothetical protein
MGITLRTMPIKEAATGIDVWMCGARGTDLRIKTKDYDRFVTFMQISFHVCQAFC